MCWTSPGTPQNIFIDARKHKEHRTMDRKSHSQELERTEHETRLEEANVMWEQISFTCAGGCPGKKRTSSFTYVCEFLEWYPQEDVLWWVSANHGEKKSHKKHRPSRCCDTTNSVAVERVVPLSPRSCGKLRRTAGACEGRPTGGKVGSSV